MNTQAHFFQKLKPFIPGYTSLAVEVSEALQVSLDSAYRRIRGEKLLDFEELNRICSTFKISLDEFFSLNSNAILFHGNPQRYQKDGMKNWLEDVFKELKFLIGHEKRHVYFLIKELSPFHHFYHPVLASFKFFFWWKSIFPNEELGREKFSLDKNYLLSYEDYIKNIVRTYTHIPSTEIWNKDALNTTLRQIESYQEMGWMESKEVTTRVYASVLEVIDHIEKMATEGKKTLLGQMPTSDSADFTLYLNEIVSGDNTIMAEIGDTKITYLNHSVLYFLGSRNPTFNESMFQTMEHLIKKSTLLSASGEKERTRVFNKFRKKVQSKIDAI
jgi:hypothetical protein